MERYSLNKYDFKNFLLAELPDSRQIDLIFWKKNIPIPVDIVYGIFERRGDLLKKYIDHIGAAYIYSFILKSQKLPWKTEIEKQPTEKNREAITKLSAEIRLNLGSSRVSNMLREVADTLLLNNYDVTEQNLVNALCHEGRKYKRLYIPKTIREIVNKYDSELLDCIGKSNGDMFSNVVADELKIYRMGFADAFSGIFNKLIDFILDFSLTGKKIYANASEIKLSVADSTKHETQPEYGSVLDGSVWEPRYVNSASSVVINENHPYCAYIKQIGKPAEEVLIAIAQIMAEIEFSTVHDRDRNVLEVFRQEISRKLRIHTEEKVSKKE